MPYFHLGLLLTGLYHYHQIPCACLKTHINLFSKSLTDNLISQSVMRHGTSMWRQWDEPLWMVTCRSKGDDCGDTRLFKIPNSVPLCLACVALTGRLLELLVDCLARCWWESVTAPCRLGSWVALCWSGSLLLWPWKLYCLMEQQQPSPGSSPSLVLIIAGAEKGYKRPIWLISL